MASFATLCISVVLGVLVGVLSGMLGIGGGMVMVPMFRLGYGMAAIQATATSLFAIIPTSVAGLATHVRNKTCYPRLGVAAGAGGALMSPVGVHLASASPSWAIMVAAAVVIGYSAATMLRKALAMPKEPSGRVDASQPSASTASPSVESSMCLSHGKLVAGFAIGMFAGLASGYVGVGGGFVMVPLFMALLGTPMKMTSGTSLIAVCILAVPGVVSQLLLGNVDIMVATAVAVGAIPGAILGANLTRRVPERTLRFVFAGLLAFAAIMLVVNEL